jgi:hypothetical protein
LPREYERDSASGSLHAALNFVELKAELANVGGNKRFPIAKRSASGGECVRNVRQRRRCTTAKGLLQALAVGAQTILSMRA